MIVDDSFSRVTTRMIVHNSFSVSWFGNHWLDSRQKTSAAALFRREKFILLQVCLTGCHLVFTFLRGKGLKLATLVTLRLPVNYRQLSRTLAV